MLLSLIVATACAVAGGSPQAGEEDDLQSRIETQRAGVSDLEKMDDLKSTTDEITLLRAWLDEAWSLRSKHEYEQVREVLDRASSQAELIRAKITASKLRAQAQKLEAAVQDLRSRITKTRKSLTETVAKKKVLEGSNQ